MRDKHLPYGFFGIGVWHPKTELNIGTLWRSAYILGASYVYTVGRRYTPQASDTISTWTRIPLLHFADLHDLREHLPYSSPLIAVEQSPQATDLHTFGHPCMACYLLGAEDHGLSEEVLTGAHKVIQIDLPLCLNVAVIGSIVMYDRCFRGTMRPYVWGLSEGPGPCS